MIIQALAIVALWKIAHYIYNHNKVFIWLLLTIIVLFVGIVFWAIVRNISLFPILLLLRWY